MSRISRNVRCLVAASGLACLLLATASAQAPKLPDGHPATPPESKTPGASRLTERLRPSDPAQRLAPVPRRNLIDEFIFSKRGATITRTRTPACLPAAG